MRGTDGSTVGLTRPSSATICVVSPPQKAIAAPTSTQSAWIELGEDVGQRQVQVDDVALAEQRHLDGRARPAAKPLLGEHDALGAAPSCRRCR